MHKCEKIGSGRKEGLEQTPSYINIMHTINYTTHTDIYMIKLSLTFAC